jgi:hypothetical protein
MDENINDDKYAKIYKGIFFSKIKTKKKSKVIAFDLDETLGSFVDLEILWRFIGQNYIQEVQFNQLLDLYPEFLRYGILSILEYLYQKKQTDECSKLYIYTNNQCSPTWTNMISQYFDYKLNLQSPLFDQIINAFKINDKKIEMLRTTHDKTYNDFITCTLLPKTTEICFVDNSYFDKMRNDCIYYIQPRSYYHNLSVNEMVGRFIHSNIGTSITNENKQSFYANVFLFFQRDPYYKYSQNNKIKIEMDIYVAHKIMYHIKEFFFLAKRKRRTKKIKLYYGKLTRKKR